MERITDILDEEGRVTGSMSLDEAHAKGILHRSIHVLVVDKTGRIFVRRRPASKPIYSDLWTSSVGTHVLSGMNPDEVAKTALKDFLGLDVQLSKIGEVRINDQFENEFITVYFCSADSIVALDPSESSEGAFMFAAQIQKLDEAHKTTPHLIGAVGVYTAANLNKR
jgi:isopentenyldiphosphate isomerase